jgi:hypothetical protein
MNLELIKRCEDLLIAMKGHTFATKEIENAYYDLMELLVDIKIKQEAEAMLDLDFQLFLNRAGISKKGSQ